MAREEKLWTGSPKTQPARHCKQLQPQRGRQPPCHQPVPQQATAVAEDCKRRLRVMNAAADYRHRHERERAAHQWWPKWPRNVSYFGHALLGLEGAGARPAARGALGAISLPPLWELRRPCTHTLISPQSSSLASCRRAQALLPQPYSLSRVSLIASMKGSVVR